MLEAIFVDGQVDWLNLQDIVVVVVNVNTTVVIAFLENSKITKSFMAYSMAPIINL